MLASRYVTFYKSLINCNKFPVRFLARINERDMRTILGKTLNTITQMFSPALLELEDLNANLVKLQCRYFEVPLNEKWRLPLLTELLQVRKSNLSLGNFEKQEVDEMIKHLCVT